MSELIYKQDAIDLVKEVCDAIMSGCDSHYNPETEDEVYNDILEVDAILKCNKEIRIALANLPSAEPENTAPKTFEEQMNLECEFCRCHECGDTLYELSDWDDYGIGFDYIRDIKYCPICGRKLFDD